MKLFVFLVAAASATTYFSEKFDGGLPSSWVASTFKPEAERGTLEAAGNGVQTTPDARFFQLRRPSSLSSSFDGFKPPALAGRRLFSLVLFSRSPSALSASHCGRQRSIHNRLGPC